MIYSEEEKAELLKIKLDKKISKNLEKIITN